MIRKIFGILFLIILIAFTAMFLQNRFLAEPVINEDVDMPSSLHPVVEERSNQLIEKAAAKGITILITDGFRSAAEQDRLYEKGRSSEGNIVTHARGGESFHNFGLAIDFAIKLPSGDVIWDRHYDGNGNSVADWTEVVTIAKELGFAWGGDWANFKDYPHLEMNFGLTINDLQNGARPPEQPLVVNETGGTENN